jgi:hypothetical protein
VFDNQVTRFFPGATDSRETQIFSDIYALDRTSKLIEYLNEFIDYAGPTAAGTSGGFILTGAGSVAQLAGDGGLINLVSPVSTFQSLQKTPAFIQLVSGYRSWFKFIGRLDSLLGNTIVGMVNVTAAPFTGGQITDGIWFTTDVTTGEIKGNVATAGTVQTVDLGVQIIANQFYQLAYYHDGEAYNIAPNGRIIFEAVTAPNYSVAGVSAPGRNEIAPIPAFPGSTLLAPLMAVNASTAVARTLTIDQFYHSKDRTNINATPPF